MSSKGDIRGQQGHNLKLTLDILELIVMRKKKSLEFLMVVLKFTLDVFELMIKNLSFLSNLVRGDHSFFNLFQGVLLKTKIKKPWSTIVKITYKQCNISKIVKHLLFKKL